MAIEESKVVHFVWKLVKGLHNHIDDERILTRPPKVDPVPEGISRPRWSVMIPVFNCSRYLPQTLESVLIQDPGPARMQIEVVDDGSTDADVAELVRRISGDRVRYFRQPQNVGSLRNFHTCLQRSTGELIHLLHGDDLVRKGFYQSIGNLFDRQPAVGAAFCRYGYIDEQGRFLHAQDTESHKDGILSNWLERIIERQRIQYVAMVVKREVYEDLGGFYGVEYGEDWEMWVRIAAKYGVGYVPQILADYRRHKSSISGRSFLTGKNMNELQTVMNNIGKYLPEEKRVEIGRKSRKFYAHYAMRIANSLWIDLRNKSGAVAQVQAAWNMGKDPLLVMKILKLYTRMMLNL